MLLVVDVLLHLANIWMHAVVYHVHSMCILLQLLNCNVHGVVCMLSMCTCSCPGDDKRWSERREKCDWRHQGPVYSLNIIPDSKVHGANMGLTWGRQDPGGPHVGPINLAIREIRSSKIPRSFGAAWLNLNDGNIVITFFCGCVPEVVPSYVVGLIYIYPGKAGFCFFHYCAVLWFRLFAHYTTSLSSL